MSRDSGIKAEIIGGYENAETLRNKLSGSHEICKILNLSDLKGLLKGGERSIIDRVALTEILKTTILSLYSANMLSNEYVKDVGYAWDREKLPLLPADADALANAVKSGSADQMISALGIKDVPHSVKTYLEKITAEVSGTENEPKLRDLQKAFLTAIAERTLAKAKLDGAGKPNGLADQQLEVILGRKLLQQKVLMTEGKGLAITPEIFVEQNDVDAATFFGRLTGEVKTLCQSSDPRAINALVELIPKLAEQKILQQQKKEEILFNAASVHGVLGAA